MCYKKVVVSMSQEKQLYRYIYGMILNNIFNGKYVYNQKLPSIESLCEEYQVGRNTIRSALLELEKDGYLQLNRGVPPLLVFNVKDFANNINYRQSILNSKEMIYDINQTLMLIMPNISIVCLDHATSLQLDELKKQATSLTLVDIHSEFELVNNLYNLYDQAFHFLNNPVLCDFFKSLMNTLTIPLYLEENVHAKLIDNINIIKKAVLFALMLYQHGNRFLFKKVIYRMCYSNLLRIEKYIQKICSDLKPEKSFTFLWLNNREQDFLYNKTITAILNDINTFKYTRENCLPSIRELAEVYEVSEKTIRITLATLNEFKILETKNGIGSKVTVEPYKNNMSLLNHSYIKNKIKNIADLLEVITLICNTVLIEKKQSFNFETMHNLFTLETNKLVAYPLYEYILSDTTNVLKSFYHEFSKTIGWCDFFCLFILDEKQIANYKNLATPLTNALKKQNMKDFVEKYNTLSYYLIDELRKVAN